MEKALKQDREFIASIFRSIPADVPAAIKQEWIENPKSLSQVLAESLYPSVHLFNPTVWKTISVAGYWKNSRRRFHEVDFHHWMYEKFKMHHKVMNLFVYNSVKSNCFKSNNDLVIVTLAELGFDKPAHMNEVCKKALKFGLALCTADIALQLRLQYPNQPEGEHLIMAMEPLSDGNNRKFILSVSNRGGNFWIDVANGDNSLRLIDDHVVFVKPPDK